MDKVLVVLYVPALEKKYDIWIPANKKIHTIIKLLTKAVSELNDSSYVADKPLLYDKNTGKPYDLNLIIKDTDIRSGAEVVLI